MNTFEGRLIMERFFLEERINKLMSFIKGDIFKKLDEESKTNLERQSIAMEEYHCILNKRIKDLDIEQDIYEFKMDFSNAMEAAKLGHVVTNGDKLIMFDHDKFYSKASLTDEWSEMDLIVTSLTEYKWQLYRSM